MTNLTLFYIGFSKNCEKKIGKKIKEKGKRFPEYKNYKFTKVKI